MTLEPPPLRDDCFALPRGTEWVHIDDALGLLRARLTPVAGIAQMRVEDTLGAVLARPAVARRANPPAANSAVDGFALAGASVQGPGPFVMPLVDGRAAAGAPFEGTVPDGCAIRILTGALVPEGVDTIVLEEDCTVEADRIAFRGPVRPGANCRRAGEDFDVGTPLFPAGHRLGPTDLATLSAAGLETVDTFAPLTVAILSTGDELVSPGEAQGPQDTADANRPMLAAMLRRWGYRVLDLGIIADTAYAVRAALDAAARDADAIVTSGGASAGDEDHLSAVLNAAGAMELWRIAIKPGRPLALGLWQGTPVFGLPGNPVAAFVCTAVFARPALARLAGRDWPEPQGFLLPAAFAKSKKDGRTEFLRARVRDGRAEVYRSEGSGRVSSLSWAEGLVRLDHGAAEITEGDPVLFLPYGAFEL